MTDASTEVALPTSTIAALVQPDDEVFVDWATGLDAEEYFDVGYALAHMSKTSALRAGWTAYQIRTLMPDGEWGQQVYRMAEFWEVSERTIHRWMKTAQESFGFELTAAQMNAAAAPQPTARQEGGPAAGVSEEWAGEDEDDPFAGLTNEADDQRVDGEGGFWGWDPEQGKDVWMPDESAAVTSRHPLLDQMNDEAGWGDSGLPPVEHGGESPQTTVGRAPAVEPDPTWVDFTAMQIQAEHGGYGEDALRRMAAARWSRKIEEDPLDLLEEIEMIYDAAGGAVPDDIIVALHEAEEHKAIVPDEVTAGGGKKKGKRGPASRKLAYDQAEKIMTSCRQLHETCFVGHRDGTVTDKEIAAMLPHLTSIPNSVKGLIQLAKEAKDRYLATNPPMEDRIAETQATETPTEEDF